MALQGGPVSERRGHELGYVHDGLAVGHSVVLVLAHGATHDNGVGIASGLLSLGHERGGDPAGVLPAASRCVPHGFAAHADEDLLHHLAEFDGRASRLDGDPQPSADPGEVVDPRMEEGYDVHAPDAGFLHDLAASGAEGNHVPPGGGLAHPPAVGVPLLVLHHAELYRIHAAGEVGQLGRPHAEALHHDGGRIDDVGGGAFGGASRHDVRVVACPVRDQVPARGVLVGIPRQSRFDESLRHRPVQHDAVGREHDRLRIRVGARPRAKSASDA